MTDAEMTDAEMTEPVRIDPPKVADEREMLVSWLDFHRETLALKCAGLTDAQLRVRSTPPSTLSLLGLVRHMAEVERGWFRRTLAGEDVAPIYYSDDSPDGDFHDLYSATPEETFATWRQECELAREATIRASSLDVTGLRHEVPHSLRWILVHMIEEYARHNGHADILRERLDGATGE